MRAKKAVQERSKTLHYSLYTQDRHKYFICPAIHLYHCLMQMTHVTIVVKVVIVAIIRTTTSTQIQNVHCVELVYSFLVVHNCDFR